MGTLNFKFTEEEIQQLLQKYQLDEKSGLVNYADFCNNIDKVFGEESNPAEVLGNNKSTAVSIPSYLMTMKYIEYRTSPTQRRTL